MYWYDKLFKLELNSALAVAKEEGITKDVVQKYNSVWDFFCKYETGNGLQFITECEEGVLEYNPQNTWFTIDEVKDFINDMGIDNNFVKKWEYDCFNCGVTTISGILRNKSLANTFLTDAVFRMYVTDNPAHSKEFMYAFLSNLTLGKTFKLKGMKVNRPIRRTTARKTTRKPTICKPSGLRKYQNAYKKML